MSDRLTEFINQNRVKSVETIASQTRQTLRYGLRVMFQSMKNLSFKKGMSSAQSLEQNSIESDIKSTLPDNSSSNILENSEAYVDSRGNPFIYISNYSGLTRQSEEDLLLWAELNGINVTTTDPSI